MSAGYVAIEKIKNWTNVWENIFFSGYNFTVTNFYKNK